MKIHMQSVPTINYTPSGTGTSSLWAITEMMNSNSLQISGSPTTAQSPTLLRSDQSKPPRNYPVLLGRNERRCNY